MKAIAPMLLAVLLGPVPLRRMLRATGHPSR